MAWPPPVFDFTFTNATSQLDDHPNIHNEVNDSLNTDFRPRIDSNTALADANTATADTDRTNFNQHQQSVGGTWEQSYTNLTISGQNDAGSQLIKWRNAGHPSSFSYDGRLAFRFDHRQVTAWFSQTVIGNVTGLQPGVMTFLVDAVAAGVPFPSGGGLLLNSGTVQLIDANVRIGQMQLKAVLTNNVEFELMDAAGRDWSPSTDAVVSGMVSWWVS